MKERDILFWGAVAVGAYWLYSKFSTAAGTAANAIAAPIANAYVNLTSGAAPVAQGNIILPDGTAIPASSVQLTWYGNALTFVYGGSNYQLQPQVNGNYPAIYWIGA